MAEESLLDLTMNEIASEEAGYAGSSDIVDFDAEPNPFDGMGVTSEMDRAAELKKKELFRKGKYQYEDDGSLINDSDAMIRAKEVANVGIKATDWLLEASENVADFGQGNWIDDHNDLFDAEINGKKYNMSNKDILGARALGPNATAKLAEEYKDAIDDPNAEKGIYTLKKFDGYNDDGSTKYIYKYGFANAGAVQRYKNQWTQDGFEIVEEKRFTGAENWENRFHASQDALDNRVLDHGLVYDENGNKVSRDEASGINFGSGSSELYTKDLLGTDEGKTQLDYDKNRLKSQAMQNAYNARPKGSNWIDAAQSSTVNMVADLGDFILDGLTPGDNTLLNEWSDSEYTDKVFGFDSVGQSQKLHEALAAFKKGDIVNASVHTALAAPGLLGQSLPYLIGLGTGATEAKLAVSVAKAAQKIKLAQKAGKSTEAVAQLTARMKQMKGYEKYKSYEDMPVNMARAKSILTDKGLMATHTSMVEEQLDQRVKNKVTAGEDPNLSVAETSAVWLGMLPFTLLDRMAFLDSVKSTGMNKLLKEAVEVAPDSVKNNLFVKAATNTGKILASGSEEAAQEYVQTWGEIFGANLGVDGKSFGDVLGEAALQDEALMGAIGGLGAGGLTNALVSVPKMAGGAVQGVKKGIERKRKVKNIDAVTTNLDNSDFELFMQDKEQNIASNEENINNINDIENATGRANTIEDLVKSPLKNVRDFGETVRDIAIGIALNKNSDVMSKKIGDLIANREEATPTGEFASQTLPEIYQILGIDPTEEEYVAGDETARKERNSKRIAEAYAKLDSKGKMQIHKSDSANELGPTLMADNIYISSDENQLMIDEEEAKAFEKDGIVASQLKAIAEYKTKAQETVDIEKEKAGNYRAAREEAIATGSGKKKFSDKEIKLDEFDKDPKGFVETIKSFGQKSKIVKKIRGYSDASLKKAAESPLASKAMKSAIKLVLDTRSKTRKSKFAGIEKEHEVYDTQIDPAGTRFTQESFKNIKKILDEKEYKYADERDDAIRFVNEAYARGVITDVERNAYVLDIGLKSTNAGQGKHKTLKDKKAFQAELDAIEEEYLTGDISKKDKIAKQNKVVVEYTGSGLTYAEEKDLGKTTQIGKYNAETFKAIRKYAAKSKIEYTQERDRALAMITAGLRSGHITKKQAKTFRDRIAKISKGAEINPDYKVYEEFKPNIIKTSSDIKSELEKNLKQKAEHEDAIFRVQMKTDLEMEITDEEYEQAAEGKAWLSSFEANEYIYFTDQEKEVNNVIDQFWDIETEEMTEEEIKKDKEDNQFSFVFC